MIERVSVIRSLALSVLVLCSMAVTGAQSGTPAAAAREPPRTEVWFTAEDSAGQCVQGLRAEDLRVTEDGTAQQITSFEAHRDAARAIVVAIDNSLSEEMVLPAVKRVAKVFIPTLLRPQDRVAVVSFSAETTLEQEFTASIERAQKAVDGIMVTHPEVAELIGPPPGKNQKTPGSTSMRDALWLLGSEVFANAPQGSRRVIVLMTDGQDTASETKRREAMTRLLGANAVVYAFGVGDPKNYQGIDKHALKELAERTGGRAFFPIKDPEVRAVLAEIGRLLDCQGLLTYTPADSDPKRAVRRLKIEIADPELRKRGVHVSYQEAYVYGDAKVSAAAR